MNIWWQCIFFMYNIASINHNYMKTAMTIFLIKSLQLHVLWLGLQMHQSFLFLYTVKYFTHQ